MGGEQCSNASSWRPLETLARVAKIRTQTDGFTKTKTRQREFGDASYSTLRYRNGRVSFTDGMRSLDTTAIAVRSVVYQFGFVGNESMDEFASGIPGTSIASKLLRSLEYWLDLVAKNDDFPEDIFPVPMLALQK